MVGCITEDDLYDLARGGQALGDTPELEAHLADCSACSALLCALLAGARDEDEPRNLTGRTLGPYRLDALLGAGAMGEVYAGWDQRLARPVAVKVLPAALAESPDRVRRLEAEGRAAAAIAHPNVVTIYDTGSDDGHPYIVTELLGGESLRSVLDRGRVPRRTALDLGLQLARGLAAAHAGGVVHRDLKPGNLLVTSDGTLKILDFGLAKLTGDREVEATEPGTLLGTAGYLSPEQARGEPADARSDLFAVGAILHELLSGQRAFGGATFAERLSGVLRDTPPPLDDPAATIVARCLEKDPRERFQSAGDLAWVLESQLADGVAVAAPPPRGVSRRLFLVGAAATGVGGVVLGRALTPARRPFVAEYQQLTFRQGRVASARFTRDGGSLIFSAAWEDLPTTIYTSRLAGGGTRPLELPPAQLLAISSRGELALALDPQVIEGFHVRGHLAVAPLEGGEPRGLGLDVQHADFTPDGGELAIVRRVGGRFRLELPAGNVLLEAGWLSHPRVSPDGKLVACLVHEDPDDDRGDVVIVTRAGGGPRTVAEGWSSVDGLVWAANGRALWVSASSHGGNNSVRALGLDGRRLARVPSAGRLRVHDRAPDGRLAVTQVSGRVWMMVRAPGAAAEADLALADVSLASDLSADGRSLLLTAFGDTDTADGAYLRPTAGGPALRLGEGVALDLADDGRGVLAFLYGEPRRLAVFPVPEGQASEIPLPGLVDLRGARWCAGGILVDGAAAGRPRRLWRRDDAGVAPVTDEGVHGPMAVSPDGRRAALLAGDRLLVVDVASGAATMVPGVFVDEDVCGFAAGGAEVLLRSLPTPVAVRRVHAVTGAAQDVLRIVPPPLGRRGVIALAVSPDAAAYAYSYGQELSRLYTMTTEDG